MSRTGVWVTQVQAFWNKPWTLRAHLGEKRPHGEGPFYPWRKDGLRLGFCAPLCLLWMSHLPNPGLPELGRGQVLQVIAKLDA